MTAQQVLSPDIVNTYTPLGIIALMIIFGFWLARLFFRDREKSRVTSLQIKLAEQETLRQRDADTRTRETEFFKAIGDIREVADGMKQMANTNGKLVEANETLIEETTRHNADEDSRNGETVKALRAIVAHLESLGMTYQSISANYQALSTGQKTIDENVVESVHKINEMLTEVRVNSTLLREVKEMVAKLDEQLSTPQVTHPSRDTVNESKADLDIKPQEANHETVS